MANYLIAGAVVGAIAVIRALFITAQLPWLLFIPGILLIGLTLAEGPAIFATVFSAVLAGLAIGSPTEPWWLTGPQWGGTLVFVIVATALSLATGALRSEIWQARVLTDALAEREAFLTGVLAASTDCIKVLDLEGRLIFMSEGGMKVMEISDFNDVANCPWPDFWSGEGNVEAKLALDRARAGGSHQFVADTPTYLGTPRSWNVTVSPIRDRDGAVSRILSVSRDVTAEAVAQARQRLLNEELQHRLKNVLTLVQSIANQTFRQATDVTAASASFAARLEALGRATDVLTATSWRAATVREVAETSLASLEHLADRVALSGPDVELEPNVCLALALAFHELATNACKYGSLSNDRGQVSLDWSATEGSDDAPGRFKLQWQESGGPTVVPPTRTGFGSKMIERSLRSYFRGEASLRYDPAGLVFRIDAPMPAAIDQSGDQT